MGRAKGYGKKAARRRAASEDALALLAQAKVLLPIVALRVEQAIRRTGLTALLVPALTDINTIAQSINQAQTIIKELGIHSGNEQ